MKKIKNPISVLLSLLMVVSLFAIVPITANADAVFNGEGTQQSPFLIQTSADWRTFAETVNTSNAAYGDKYYKLTDNIVVTGDDATSSLSVGDSARPFRGHFDGGGYTLTYNYSGKGSGIAPFQYVNGATVENLNVAGAITISAGGYTRAAGIAGYVTGNTTIRNCTSDVALYVNSRLSGEFGGIAGYVESGVMLNIDTAGDYTLTVTGIGKYTGSLSHSFTVFDKPQINYLDAAGAVRSAEIVPVFENTTKMSAGWYAVTEDVTVSDRINVSGDVHLILCDLPVR